MTFKAGSSAVAILAVEDDISVWIIATEVLVNAGFRVIEAHDAEEALTLLEAGSDAQVIITDWNMPGEIGGVALGRLVRKRWPSIAVIVTYGNTQPAPSDLPTGMKLLAKPYRPSILIKEIEALVRDIAEVRQGVPVLPDGIVAHSPVMTEIGGMGVAAAQREPDKT